MKTFQEYLVENNNSMSGHNINIGDSVRVVSPGSSLHQKTVVVSSKTSDEGTVRVKHPSKDGEFEFTPKELTHHAV